VIQSQQQEKKDALQRQLAAAGVIPLSARVDASTVTAGADAERRDTQGQGNICVGGGDPLLGPNTQVAVYGMQGLKQRGIISQAPGGAIPNAVDQELKRSRT
jgi:hypothetical protein